MTWPSAHLSDVVRFVGGGTPSKANPAFWSGLIPWVSPKDMLGRDIWDSQDHITEEAISQSSTQLIPPGSVLIVVRSGILVRHLPVGITRRAVALNQDMKALVPTISGLNSEFLAYFLEFRSANLLANCVKRGATVHSIDTSKLKLVTIPLPPPSEQERIVEILNQAEALRKKRTKVDGTSERILPSIFLKLYGDPATNPKGWDKGQLGDVLIETQYGTSVKADAEGTGVVVLRMNNIDKLGFLDLRDLKYAVLQENELLRQKLVAGDILFNRTNSKELVGKTGLWQGGKEAVAASYLIRVRVNRERVLPEFIWAYMNTPFMKQTLFDKARRAIGMANINATELRSLPVVIPEIDVQRSFTRILASLERLNMNRSASSEKIDTIFNVLLNRAFSGDLTAKWRESHLQEILAEMEAQKKALETAASQSVLSI